LDSGSDYHPDCESDVHLGCGCDCDCDCDCVFDPEKMTGNEFLNHNRVFHAGDCGCHLVIRWGLLNGAQSAIVLCPGPFGTVSGEVKRRT
jgi:hypothetical protein